MALNVFTAGYSSYGDAFCMTILYKAAKRSCHVPYCGDLYLKYFFPEITFWDCSTYIGRLGQSSRDATKRCYLREAC